MILSNIRKFIFHELRSVEGYIDPPDALVYLSILERQRGHGLGGGIAEIGVYFGRSYFLLKKITSPEDRVLGIDLFDIGEMSNGVSEQYRTFIENGERLGLPVDEDLLFVGDSAELSPKDVASKVGKVRFFSIDGGHTLSNLKADIHLAKETIADHGVIVFDDTFNPAWPEVTVGVADFLRDNDEIFSAFCMTKYKTYVCRREFHDFYRAAILRARHLRAFELAETHFLGSDAVRLHNPFGRRILYELMTRSGMSAISERAYRCH
ncbi:class I SAM-dependent methyltransferase [Rhizobium sp. CB3171]|uniref:class I SAM-dependent methyltransferase n=1 Tax=Rhizobium sp. CB3171 TaxID=3039157 RepID=UPI0024B1ACC9|nr:class I SAM-dependent methyltransferase [Rhizobium sp. CB3171]WFU03174.1 class I SAM-dependent methyltransferase [Rhizobium sp. CB3171]